MVRLPSLTPERVLRALLRAGFVEIRRKGSHCALLNRITQRRTMMPIHNRDLKRGLLKAILKQAGLTEEAFRKLL